MQPPFGLGLISSRTDTDRRDSNLSVRLCSDSCDDQGPVFPGDADSMQWALIGGQGS
jgi:hypothetical protein